MEKMLANGKTLRGVSYEMVEGRAIEFSPCLWHEVQPWEGARLVLLLFTPRATKLTPRDVEALNEVGLNVLRHYWRLRRRSMTKIWFQMNLHQRCR